MIYYHMSITAQKDLMFSLTEDGLPNEIFSFFTAVKQDTNSHLHAYAIMPASIHILLSSEYAPTSKQIAPLIDRLNITLLSHLPALVGEDNVERYKKHPIFQKKAVIKEIHSMEGACDDVHDIHFDPTSEEYSLVDLPVDYLYSSVRNYITGNGMYPVEALACKDSY